MKEKILEKEEEILSNLDYCKILEKEEEILSNLDYCKRCKKKTKLIGVIDKYSSGYLHIGYYCGVCNVMYLKKVDEVMYGKEIRFRIEKKEK